MDTPLFVCKILDSNVRCVHSDCVLDSQKAPALKQGRPHRDSKHSNMPDIGDKVDLTGAECCAAPFLLAFGCFYIMGNFVKGCVCAPCDAILAVL